MLTEKEVRKIVANANTKVDWMVQDKNTTFQSVGLDSLDHYEIIVGVQEATGFEVPDADVAKLDSIQSITSYFAEK